MPPVGPVKRRDLLASLRPLGYHGPFAGKRHQFMRGAERTVRLPNPHRGEISRGQTKTAHIWGRPAVGFADSPHRQRRNDTGECRTSVAAKDRLD